MISLVRKWLGREQLNWASDSPSLPDFGLSRIEMKLVACLIVLQTLVLALLLL